MSKGNKQDRKSSSLRKKKFLKAAGGEKGKTPEEDLEEKMLNHVKSLGYTHCEPECTHTGYESG